MRQLPDWETLPYDAFSPHQDLISERLHTLHSLMMKTVDVLTVPVTTALYRLAPPSFLAAYTFSFKQKDKLNEAALRAQLTLSLIHISIDADCTKYRGIPPVCKGDFNHGSQCVISCERPLAAGSCHCYISGHEYAKHHPHPKNPRRRR